MARKKRPLLVWISGIIVAGGVFLFSWERPILSLTNLDRPCTLRFILGPGERFRMFYIHSIYNQPATEEFELRSNGIVLKGVRARHPGVMEYYGFNDALEFHEMDKALGHAFIVKIAMQPGQGFRIAGKEIPLKRIGRGGERIEVRAHTESVGWAFLRGLTSAWESCERAQLVSVKK